MALHPLAMMLTLSRGNQYARILTFSIISKHYLGRGMTIFKPAGFSRFTRWLANGDDFQCCLFGVFSFDKNKASIGKEPFSRFILVCIRWSIADCGELQTNFEKSNSTRPSVSSRQTFPSLLCASIPRSRNLSPALPRSCLVDLS